MDFSELLYRLSDGRFDITSGVLREAWRFDGSDRVPTQSAIEAILPRIGWDRVRWEDHTLTLRPGMQIDLGGVGKEYAVDRCAGLCREHTQASCLVLRQAQIFGYLRVFLAPDSFLARGIPSRSPAEDCSLARGIPSRSPAEGSVAPPCVVPATPRRRASPGTKNPSQLHSHLWT